MPTPSIDTKVQSETLEQIAERIAKQYTLPFERTDREGLRQMVLSALQNERERCAKIADGEAQEWSRVSSNYKAHDPMKTKAISRSAMARELATAIREGR